MSNNPILGSFSDSSGSALMFRNKLINGGFDIWQRATSQTSSGYGSMDRWTNDHSGSTKTTSRQSFALGQTDVPNSPTYFARTVVSSVAGANNYVVMGQRAEGVSTLAGRLATLSFWAKADSNKNISVELTQNFGTGGSPSTSVDGIGVSTVSLSATWKFFSISILIPSIAGKVAGTGNNDFLGVNFWFDAGSSFNARTNSLGQQSGTFDIANVQLEAGGVATPFEQRPLGMELSLCQRYCERMDNASGQVAANFCWGLASTTTNVNFILPFAATKRAVPTSFLASAGGTFQAANGNSGFSISAMSFGTVISTTTSAGFSATVSGVTQYAVYYLQTVNGQTPYIIFSAEL
jgi:hypothetical protein